MGPDFVKETSAREFKSNIMQFLNQDADAFSATLCWGEFHVVPFDEIVPRIVSGGPWFNLRVNLRTKIPILMFI